MRTIKYQNGYRVEWDSGQNQVHRGAKIVLDD
jgi:hypothetical protein